MEEVLAIPTALAREFVCFKQRGLEKGGIDALKQTVTRHGVFLARSTAEEDASFKQIIPYGYLRCGNKYLLLRRKRTQGERRLHDKLSVGIGGHINAGERGSADLVHAGLTRELNEELELSSSYTTTSIGLINDDSSEVGRVHLGVLFEIEVSASCVRVRETDKMSGRWVALGELRDCLAEMETWSQIVCMEHLLL